eukprot:CAMPEP_0116875696 /NCGR_PEP_ID=MMETSP0463-20121206/7745_1 /TAXON_ID=181622 /ORGANISM="Strombidinopsis sp, Strain SopsisLIS2011" /LENGTH=55 /DNA_ID=CAMNT_0004521773 /DNA_START=140 /DNA_END=307 /DNA_ORIENTATION=+
MANGKNGYCCDTTNCPKVDICSSDAKSNSDALKWWACPHDDNICDDLFYIANTST